MKVQPDGSTRFSRVSNDDHRKDTALARPALTSGKHEWLVEVGADIDGARIGVASAHGGPGVAKREDLDSSPMFCGVGILSGQPKGAMGTRNAEFKTKKLVGHTVRLIADMGERKLYLAFEYAEPLLLFSVQ